MGQNKLSFGTSRIASAEPQELQRVIVQLQSDLRQIVDALNTTPFLFGRQIENITIAAGASATITHGLNRAVRWFPIYPELGTNYFLNTTATAPNTITIRNSGAASVTFDAWVY